MQYMFLVVEALGFSTWDITKFQTNLNEYATRVLSDQLVSPFITDSRVVPPVADAPSLEVKKSKTKLLSSAGGHVRGPGTLYGVVFSYSSFRRAPIFSLNVLNVNEFTRLLSVFGRSTVAIHSFKLLILLWVFFFILLGFVSLERSRVIIILSMVVTTLVLIYLGFYELQELDTSLLSTRKYRKKKKTFTRYEYLHTMESNFFIKLKKIKKKINISYLYRELGDSFFPKPPTRNFILEFFFPKKIETPYTLYTGHDQTLRVGSIQGLYRRTAYAPLSNSLSLYFRSVGGGVDYLFRVQGASRKLLSRELVGDYSTCAQSLCNQRAAPTPKLPNPYNKIVSEHEYMHSRISTSQKVRDFAVFVLALRSEHSVFSVLNLGVLTSALLGSVVTALAGCYGLNSKVMRHRRFLWMSSKVRNNYRGFRKFWSKINKKLVYRPWGGCGYIEFTSVEKNPFCRRNKHPATVAEIVSPLFWVRQFRLSIYNRVSTTTVWVVLLLTPLMFSYSHPQWRLLALLLLLLYTLVFIVQEVRPCVSFSVFGGGKRCFQAVRRVLCKKRSVGMLQVLLFRPAPAQPQETEKTSILFTLLGVVAAVCILGLAASLSTVDMQVSFVSAFLTFWLLCAYTAHALLKHLTARLGVASATTRTVSVLLSFFFMYLTLCFLLAKITLFFFTGFSVFVPRQLTLLYLILVFCYLGVSSREGVRSLLHPKDRYLATWSFFWSLKYLCISLYAVVCFNSGLLLGLLIPYVWAVVLVLPYCRSLFLSCMRGGALADGSATPTVDTFYSKHLVSIGLCALVNLSYCLFYSNPLTVPSLAFYVALIAFYLRSPSVGKRLQLLGSLFVCSVTTICLLASIGFDFDVLPGEFFLVTKNELCGVYLVLWVWSYTRLGSTLIRIKSMEFFLFLSAVLLPLVLLVFYDLLQKLDSDIPAAALVAYLVVSVPSLVQPIYWNNPTTATVVSRQPTDRSASLKSLLRSYIAGCYFFLAFVALVTPSLTASVYVAAVLIVAAKSIIGAWVLITLTGSIRTASVHELTGSLANFRFLKKVYNVLVFLIIVFLSLVLWLLL